ncbi:hypothetical protein OUZ56_015009 [Daphnia magna]|uniref:Uncharacterized protein n=1 Tax=Daphnia magna TaxID=35525 RepID=A0ABR0ALH7_9CRUS|nr:hypothetical protein OUZ56_015009 [Daphnia magna]
MAFSSFAMRTGAARRERGTNSGEYDRIYRCNVFLLNYFDMLLVSNWEYIRSFYIHQCIQNI